VLDIAGAEVNGGDLLGLVVVECLLVEGDDEYLVVWWGHGWDS
jgi:hypothetical protein